MTLYQLDWIAENFSGDFIFLVYRESQKSFAWWCEVMDFTEDHWPDYRPGYTDYNTMHERIRYENAYMLDFAIRNDMAWMPASDVNSFCLVMNLKIEIKLDQDLHYLPDTKLGQLPSSYCYQENEIKVFL